MGQHMISRKMFTSLIALGVIAILASWLWPYLISGDRVWSEARAQELNQATVQLHEQLHAHGHAHEEEFGHNHGDEEHSHLEHPDAIAASKRYRETQGHLESAKFWHSSASVYLRWAGFAVVLGGLTGLYAVRPGSEA
jgi:hypothetical protein